MIDLIAYIHSRLDRLAVLPLAFAVVLSLVVVTTAVFEGAAAPQAQTAGTDLTTTAAAVP